MKEDDDYLRSVRDNIMNGLDGSGGGDPTPPQPKPLPAVDNNNVPIPPGNPNNIDPNTGLPYQTGDPIIGDPKGPGPGAVAPPAPSPSPTPNPSLRPNTQPSIGNALPPEIQSLLEALRNGISSFSAPQINYQPQATPAYGDAVRSAILSALEEGQRPVDASDPLVAPMISALDMKAQRSKESNANDLAERLSAQHLLSSGAYDVGRERYNQGVDEANAGTTAQMMTSVLSDRKNRLMQALQLGANYLNADQARQLQAELANVNSALSVYSVKANAGLSVLENLLRNQQFYDSLGLQAGEFAQDSSGKAVTF